MIFLYITIFFCIFIYFFHIKGPWTLFGLYSSSADHHLSFKQPTIDYLNSIRKSWLLRVRLIAGLEGTSSGVKLTGETASGSAKWKKKKSRRVFKRLGVPTSAPAPAAEKWAHVQVPGLGKKKEQKEKKSKKDCFFLRIVKRELNLMRSMQQGISTHYNTRFGI